MHEMRDPDAHDQPMIIAALTLKTGLKMLDLTNLPEVPSIFDAENRWKIEPILFLRKFIEDASSRVDPEKQYEYAPTQIVCEYLRFCVAPERHQGLHGIVYRSVQSPGGTCYVFFPRLDEKGVDDEWFLENFSGACITASPRIL